MEWIINATCDDTFKDSLIFIFSQLSEGLDLETLEYILLPNDFATELYAFQREHGLREEFTKDEIGFASGKTLCYFADKKFKQSIFLNPKIFCSTQLTTSTLHHELCHVHDDYMQFKMFGPSWFRAAKDLSDDHRKTAGKIWSEYIANRLMLRGSNINECLNANSELISCDMESIEIRIPETKKTANKAISRYRFHRDINQLMAEMSGSIFQLLIASGKVYGILHAANKENVNKILDNWIENTYFEDIWGPMNEKLLNLYNSYPNWENPKELDNLGEIVLKTYNLLGIYPKETDQGLYIGVPFT